MIIRSIVSTAYITRSTFVVLFLLLMGFPCLVMPQNDPIDLLYLIDLDGRENAFNTLGSILKSLNYGYRAAFYASNYKTKLGRPINLHRLTPGERVSDLEPVIQRVLSETNNKLLAAIGPYSDRDLTSALELPTVIDNNITFLSPYTGASSVRNEFSLNVYFLRAGPRAEFNALMHYVTDVLNNRRIGFMYLSGIPQGEREHERINELLKEQQRNPTIDYVQPFFEEDGVTQTFFSEEAYEKFASQRPQSIFLYGGSGQHMLDFIKRCFNDPRMANITYLATSFQYFIILMDSEAAAAAVYGQGQRAKYIATGTNPLPIAQQYEHIKQFQREMDDYLANGQMADLDADQTPYEAGIYKTDLIKGELMVMGWIAGSTILQALDGIGDLTDRPAFVESLFSQRNYIVGKDMMLGTMGGYCPTSDLALAQGVTCECNSVGRTVWMTDTRMTSDGWEAFSLDYTYNFNKNKCAAEEEPPYTTIAAVFFNNPNYDDANSPTKLHEELIQHFQTLFATWEDGSENRISTFPVTCEAQTIEDEGACAKNFIADNYCSVFIGPIITSRASPNFYFVVDPMPQALQMKTDEDRVIYILPTLEQILYVYYSRKEIDFGKTAIITRGLEDPDKFRQTIDDTTRTFKAAAPKIIAEAARGASVTDNFSKDGDTIFFGFSNGDAPYMAKFLEENPNARIQINYRSFAGKYEEVLEHFGNASLSVQSRLLIVTNFPLWSDVNNTQKSKLLLEYKNTLPEGEHPSPLSLYVYILGRFLSQIQRDSGVPALATELKKTVYSLSTFSLREVTFGPYELCTEDDEKRSGACTLKNYGARSIRTISFAHAMNPSQVNVTYEALTPDMVYAPVEKKFPVLVVVLPVVFGVLAIIVVVIIISCCCCGGSARDNHNAPQNNTEPITLVFTDIESSTALWATIPSLMPDAIATHHRLIRELIAKYKCYEVKTIGDSFMIACKSASNAVKLASDIQTTFLKHNWGTEEIDECYRTFELEKESKQGGYDINNDDYAMKAYTQNNASPTSDYARDFDRYYAPSAHLPPEEYVKLWNGLRVRIGINNGLSDIRQDEITGGFDYYGETSNMAARTEAIANGGQIILTEYAYWSLTDEERNSINIYNHGPQVLRGVTGAVSMYQLNAVPGRTHTKLRTEMDFVSPVDDVSKDNNASVSQDSGFMSSIQSGLKGPAAAVSIVLTTTYATFAPKERIRVLQPILTRWSVPTPPRHANVKEEDYSQGLINRLAGRVVDVIRRKEGEKPQGRGLKQRISDKFSFLGFHQTINTVAGTNPSVSESSNTGRNITQRKFSTKGLSAQNVSRLSRDSFHEHQNTSVVVFDEFNRENQPALTTKKKRESLFLADLDDEVEERRTLKDAQPVVAAIISPHAERKVPKPPNPAVFFSNSASQSNSDSNPYTYRGNK